MSATPLLRLVGLLLSAALGAGPVASAATPARPPNLIFIMADDLGYAELGCFGQKEIATPQLDQLAAEGMRLTDFYAGCTVCRPSRLVLWTGLHTGHTPIWSNASYTFPPDAQTLPRLLHAAGYATGGVGKWAMGQPGSTGVPHRQGFDTWTGYLDQSEAHNYFPTHLWQNDTKILLEGNVLSTDPKDRGRVATVKTTWAHPVMTDAALEFIRTNRDRPFLLHVHWTLPHANNEGGRATGNGMEIPSHGEYADRDWPDTAKGQAAMVTALDRDVGQITALVRELGLAENTLVIFTSDNGPHSEGGHDHTFFDANGPLRGYKRDLYEGGIRVPTIAWWPGTVPPNSTNDTPLAFWDVLPTFCDLAGAPAPDGLDGISFAPALRGEHQNTGDDGMPEARYLFWRFQEKAAVRHGKWKAVRPARNAPVELYDLESDPGESADLAASRPDIARRLALAMSVATKAGFSFPPPVDR